MKTHIRVSLLIVVASVIPASSSYANDLRCNAPPYGDTVQAFQAYVKSFGQYVAPAKFLSSICEVKFGGADRTPMYNLGITDQDIDGKPTGDLAVEMLIAIQRLAKQTN
jgi:hypothetical protein